MKKLGGKDLGHVVKSKGHLSLTEQGLHFIEENGLKIKVKPFTTVEHQESLKETIKKNAKAPEKAIDAIWTLCATERPTQPRTSAPRLGNNAKNPLDIVRQ